MMFVRFPLPLRDVEDLIHERGTEVSHESVRIWWMRFGPHCAFESRKAWAHRMRCYSNWKWHLDEVFVKITGETHHMWRAVDHEGEVLKAFVTKRRDRKAALKFLKKLMNRYAQPEKIVTDKLRSYDKAMKKSGKADRKNTGRWLNNRIENSHLPFRRRERAMSHFRRMRSSQKFAAVHSSIHNFFSSERSLYSRQDFKGNRAAALTDWRQLGPAKKTISTSVLRGVQIRLTPP